MSVDDEALGLISSRCVKLTRLKLRGCRDVSHVGMEALGKNCRFLRKFSCKSCMFGAKGMNALLNNCSSLEELSVKRLRGFGDGEAIGPGLACSNLRFVCLKELYNGQCFGPLLIGSTKLKTLRVMSCLGEWDSVLTSVCDGNLALTEIRLEKLQVSDYGLQAISKCSNLDTLHLMKVVECTDYGLAMIAKNCRLIRKLHIDGWRTNRIGDEGLIAVAKNGGNLLELVIIGLNPSMAGLAWISLCCTKLERLAICASDTIGDRELQCFAKKTAMLNKLCIKGCRLLTNNGIISFATLCPNLVKIKVRKCKRITGDVVSSLRATKPHLEIILDVNEIEVEGIDARAADGAIRLLAGDAGSPTMPSANADAQAEPRNSASLWSGLRLRIGLLGGNLVTSTLRRWSNGDENPIGNP